MKIIYNNIIPFKGFAAMNICGLLFARKDEGPVSESMLNHERIHTAQMKEMLYIFFYLWYRAEWLVRLIIHRKSAYEGISLEQEAYSNEYDFRYLQNRKHYAWIKFLRRNKK